MPPCSGRANAFTPEISSISKNFPRARFRPALFPWCMARSMMKTNTSSGPSRRPTACWALRRHDVASLYPKPAFPSESSTISIAKGTSYLLNPGSIGQPRDGDTRAAFAIADLENGSVEFWRVPYDVQDVQQRMLQAGLPEPLILRLSFGR